LDPSWVAESSACFGWG